MSEITVTPEIEEAFETGKKEAERILNDPDKMELFLQRLEQKMDDIPMIGDTLSMIPVMISFIKSYVKNDYREAPVTVPISIVAALLYLVSPIDIIKDNRPVIGLLDDIAVVYLAWRYVKKDILKYQQWRKDTGRELVYFYDDTETE